MATPQERSQAADILDAKDWAVMPNRRGGWVVVDDNGSRIWPPRADDSRPDRWLVVIEAEANFVPTPNESLLPVVAMMEREVVSIEFSDGRVAVRSVVDGPPDADGNPTPVVVWTYGSESYPSIEQVLRLRS